MMNKSDTKQYLLELDTTFCEDATKNKEVIVLDYDAIKGKESDSNKVTASNIGDNTIDSKGKGDSSEDEEAALLILLANAIVIRPPHELYIGPCHGPQGGILSSNADDA